jgi:hypothetical protein
MKPPLTGTVSGILNNDAVTANYATTASQYSDVQAGGYAITLSSLGGAKMGDYSTMVPGAKVTNGTLTITPAPLTITVANKSKVYGQVNPALTGTVSGILNNDAVTLNYTTSASQYSDVQTGGYPITIANLTGAKAGDYSTTVSGASVTNGTLTITPAPLTITVDSKSKVYSQANPTLTGTVGGILNNDAVTVNYTTTATQYSPPVAGGYPITVAKLAGAKAGDYSYTIAGASVTNATLTVNPARLSATGVNFSAMAGAPWNGTVATFINADPLGSAMSYIATIAWGDGSTSAGVISGSGSTLTVSGSHTYAGPGSATVHVQISHKLGYTTTATTSGTATITSLGLGVQNGQTAGIGFWGNSNGQALINTFNGGSSATALSAWLASTFPNLYGAGAGANNLSGKTNAQVAAFYLRQFGLQGPMVEAQVLAAALNVYATTLSLGGNAAQAYGFTVSAMGLGARSFNVGTDGAAFGVANGTTRNVYQLLLAVNQQAVNGVLYNGNATLRQQATDLIDAVNNAGGIA